MSLLVGCRRRLLVPAIGLSLSALPNATAIAAAEKAPHTPVVEELVTLLGARPLVREALEGAIRNAGLAGLDSTESFLAYVDDLITAVPTQPPRTLLRASSSATSSIRRRRIGSIVTTASTLG